MVRERKECQTSGSKCKGDETTSIKSWREWCGRGKAKQQPHERKYCFIKQIKKHFVVNSFNAKFCQQCGTPTPKKKKKIIFYSKRISPTTTKNISKLPQNRKNKLDLPFKTILDHSCHKKIWLSLKKQKLPPPLP